MVDVGVLMSPSRNTLTTLFVTRLTPAYNREEL
jgi:hypothetical protein